MKPITIMPRRDTEENWIKNNPVLKDREICVIYTQSYGTSYKVGNGCSHYTHLPFVSLERALEEGVMYADGRIVRFKGFVNQTKEKEEIEEQVYCPSEFVW